MNKWKRVGIFSVLFSTITVAQPRDLFAADASPVLTIDATPRANGQEKMISPTFYGLMTEEINHSYDGGLYAELIRNRSFKDDATSPAGWSIVEAKDGDAAISLDTQQPLNAVQSTSLKIEIKSTDGGRAGVSNGGFWGVPIKPGSTYHANFYARADKASAGPIQISLESVNGKTTFAQAQVSGLTDQWTKLSADLAVPKDATEDKAGRFVISSTTPGTIWLSLVSLFPPTFHDRPNGNRIDLMQLMADLKPAFLRCPGGNYLEGNTVDTRFQWKQTLGDVADRPGHLGCWNYRSSDGLGLLEFLEWAQDIGAQPVLAVYAGFSLSTKEHRGGTAVPAGDALKPFVQEALDEIEYATGDIKTKWGARRAADGHVQPFHIEYIEIGNEDFGAARKTYDARYSQFYDALHAAYPDMKYISTVPIKVRTPDVIDDHYYKTSDQMAALASKYDKADRKGPKIFVGEWATREIMKTDANGKVTYVMMPWEYKDAPTPTLHAALGDAAFMTGMERNADVVIMNCYAPMLTRVEQEARQWSPDMIGYDALHSFASPSYYAQQMFNVNRGNVVIDASLSDEIKDFYFSATRLADGSKIYLKAVNRTADPVSMQIDLKGLKSVDPDGVLNVLTGKDSQAMNSIESPTAIVPMQAAVSGLSNHFTQTFPPNSACVLELHGK